MKRRLTVRARVNDRLIFLDSDTGLDPQAP